MILGIGADIADIERVARIVKRSPRFVQRVYHPVEQDDAAGRGERWATRFAVKEAWLKAMALPLFSVPFNEIYVEIAADGQPLLRLTGKAQRLSQSRNVGRIHVSLSHDGGRALAFVVLEGEPE